MSSQRTILLTGANGQLGRRLVPRLMAAGYHVSAHYRSEEKAARYCPQGADAVIGDLRHPDWLPAAVNGCNVVIHGAARVSLRPGMLAEQRQINIEGTRAVIDACKQNAVKRLIYVSTIVTVGASDNGQPIDENARFNLAGFNIPYIETKREAEILALAANSPTLEVVSVNPSIMISAPDREVTKSDLRKIPRFLPAYFDFGLNLVATDDVISGIISAIEKGRAGERYLLTGENLNPAIAFKIAKKYFGISKPLIKIPVSVLMPVAYLAECWAMIRGKRPQFHRGLARLARLRFYYSHDKAARELGYKPRSLEITIREILQKINK